MLVHRPLTGPFDDAEILDIANHGQPLSVDLGAFLRDEVDDLRFELPDGLLAGWTFTRAPDHRSVIIARNGQYLTALASHEAVNLSGDVSIPEACFLPLTTPDLTALQELVSSRWLVKSDQAAPPAPAVVGMDFALRIGSLTVDLRWNLPFDLSDFPNRLVMLRDGWRIDQVHRYRPLVYYAAFKDQDTLSQLALNMQSLVNAGAYQGDIAVMTDRSVQEIQSLAPAGMGGSLVVIRFSVADRVGAIGARLAIGGWRDGWTFQPLLYVDTDIIFDRPVAPMLHAIARSDRIVAPTETKEPLATSYFVGSGLLLEDNCEPGDQYGFNAGTMGIPNLARHAQTLNLIGRILRNRGSIVGRDKLRPVDQPIANYVSFKLAHFDAELISPFVQLARIVPDPVTRQGLVHFCWAAGPDKLEVMRQYLVAVDALDGRTTVPTDAAAVPVVTSDIVSAADVANYSQNPILDFETIIQSLQK